MTPALSEQSPHDTEFDLDVRLEPLPRHHGLPGTPPPNTVSCKECGTQYSCVGCSEYGGHRPD